MKRPFLLVISLSALSIMGWAQDLLTQFAQDPGKSGGVYYAYPAPDRLQLTAPPKHYKPFYISHYGRHGSRYLLSDKDYSQLLDMLAQAHDAAALTQLGEDVLKRMQIVWAEAQGHGDELAPLGKRQHRGIAERMYRAYPHLFARGSKISARSTTSMRCALSMVSFCERLKELNPAISLDWETSRANMTYMNWHNQAYDSIKNSADGWRREFGAYCARPGIDPTRFVSQIIADTAYFNKAKLSRHRLMTAIYDVASDLQDMECGVSFYDLFTTEELLECWRNGNAWFYYCDADAPANKGTALASCSHLLQNIVEQADKAISGQGDQVTLRFGHDGNIIPLAACLHIEGCDLNEPDPTRIELSWQNFYVSPMAANIQMIFFRKNGSDDILVKFLLNEREVRLTILQSDIAPYYHWKDVRNMMLGQ